MNCNEVRALLDAHFDGELDLIHDLEIEKHLGTCPSCAQALASLKSLRSAISNSELRYSAPPGLAAKVARPAPVTSPAEPVRRARPRQSWFSFGYGVAFASVMFVAWSAVQPKPPANSDAGLASAVIDSHVRALMANHLMDVPSTDQHTVKPWFDGKLDFSPPVHDLVDKGFPLIGGRLDYLDGRPVAALVYRRRRHFINLFIWPAKSGDAPGEGKPESRQGYHVVHWVQGGNNFWAVADIGVEELEEFGGLVREKS